MGPPDPVALGRSLVVEPGAGVPDDWAACDLVAVERVDAATADALADAWRSRRAVIVELSPGLGLDDPESPPPESVTAAQPWEWPVDLDLPGERLHHAIWANAVDGREGARRYRWAEQAVALGARPAAEVPGDVVLADGTAAWCDGGPLDVGLAARTGSAVVHRVALEHDELTPLGANDVPGLDLAPDQLEAVTEPGGTARIIAPAGSGKTRVLTERARLLLGGWRLPSQATALVAFNVRARADMQERLHDVPGARTRTLNALGLALCGGRSTIEEVDVRRLLSGLVDFPRRAETDPAAPWLEALRRVRLGLVHPSQVEADLPDVSDLERVARSYRALLAERGVVDFDEQVVGAIERLLTDPPFRQRAQRFARVLLVDEFQDLTPAHLLLIRLLTGPAGSVFGVGDDDQTIYGYAGADPRWLVDFGRWFPGAALHALEVNYRCPAPVVTAASNLLTRNAVRVPKEIRAGASAITTPDALRVVSGGGGPAGRSAARVVELLDAGAAPADVAVLARVNASLAPVQILLRHGGVPVHGGVGPQFLQRGGVRAAVAWLTVATAPASALPGAVLREAARRPKRGMSASLLDLVAKQRSVDALTRLVRWLEGKGSSKEALKVGDLARDVKIVRAAADDGTTEDVLAAIRFDIGDGGLDASASALDQWSHGAIASHGDDLDALGELAALEPEPGLFAGWLADQLTPADDPDGVTLASVHAVKGREWPHVVLHHVTAGLLPHRLADDVEEERRVFHVGLTRCRASVSIVPGRPPSPFLAELDEPGEPAPGPARRPIVAAAPAAPAPGAPSDAAWERLRAWRGERARAAGKPAYVVFDDKTLRAIAATLPSSERELLAISGVGPVKLEAYGDELLAITEALRTDP